jgi:hypothetical protein
MPTRDRRLALITASIIAFTVGTMSSAADADSPTCNADLSSTKVQGGIVGATAQKRWQPRGGEFTFAVDTPTSLPADALITICFGWKRAGVPIDPKDFIESRPTRILKLEPDKKSLTVAATVPNLPPAPPRFREQKGKLGVYQGFAIVPVADVRILVYRPNGENVVDILTTVGVTRVSWAIFGAFVAVAGALVALYLCSLIRQPQLKGANALLRIIATERNYASLSQAQIILWTLVVGASAVYVMVLSGDLIDITGGTLVLLGISGAATVVAKWKSAIDDQKRAPLAVAPGPAGALPAAPAQGAAAPAPAGIVAPAAGAPAPATGAVAAPPAAVPVPLVPPKVTPEWSDLVISLERVNGTVVQTIDVTRVQMLFFTLITATFVVVKVATSFEIPPIPDGFMTLMGLSNGVYLGSKFAK